MLSLTNISIVIYVGLMENVASIMADISRLMRRAFDARARTIGVTRPQWQVLTVLKRNEGVNQGGLADLLDVEPITVCRMVDRLQDAGLVERRADAADRRSWRLHLTPKASALLDDLRPMGEGLIEEALEGIAPADRERFLALLLTVRQNLSRPATQGAIVHG
ncbi:DNA-binding MarR family transcriptional regulator [Novosphingobium kunmingense]|uniref:DNA-binding MarR family transcriptional regulator n=2 Tax=Novosphingobium kunmingense TaxID=1211806 RepID=A0A2N0I3W4_9SPHN|nr:DNA-binding MarR family transcriptional regulator [Novosphingobium kunmingense]